MANKEIFDTYIQKMVLHEPSSTNEKKDVKDVDSKIEGINEILTKAEKQKQGLRMAMVVLVSILLIAQLIFFNYNVWFVIHAIIVTDESYNVLSVEITSNLLSFLKYYISVTVVELLGMLFFMIKYAFSKIDYQNSKKKKNTKKK